MAGSPQANEAMCLQWFDTLGLASVTARYLKLQH